VGQKSNLGGVTGQIRLARRARSRDQADNIIVQWSRIVHLEADFRGLLDDFCPLNEPDTPQGGPKRLAKPVSGQHHQSGRTL